MLVDTDQFGISSFELDSIRYWIHRQESPRLVLVLLLISEEERIQALPQLAVRHAQPPTRRCEEYVLHNGRAAVKLSEKLIHEIRVSACRRSLHETAVAACGFFQERRHLVNGVRIPLIPRIDSESLADLS